MNTPIRTVVVGGGPGGMLLAYLLARAGLPVTLLERHHDFDRDFRGDSLHPWTLELLDRLGLAGRLLELPHVTARQFRFRTPRGPVTTSDYGLLDTPYDYVALMPQARFLDFLATEAAGLDSFELRTGAAVSGLLGTGTADDPVRGVRLRDGEEIPAGLVIAADGRFSKVRTLAGLTARSQGASTDLLWFALPRYPTDPPDADVDLFFGERHYVGLLGGPVPAGDPPDPRVTGRWQVGLSLPKGGYPEIRERGVEYVRREVATRVPWLADRMDLLTGLTATTLLSVDISRVPVWHRAGLLLIGDAAHVISPVGGNGILMACQDALVAADHLVPALREGAAGPEVLGAIQAEREPAIVTVQDQQVRVERTVARARERGRPVTPPSFLRLLTRIPAIRKRSARRNAYGPVPVEPSAELERALRLGPPPA
ncbi:MULTISPECIES: FAD-dependent oxidoreductase [Pseudonocardia]|uniref:Pentachlorophenol 4-monooxygenase n=2 Tax=Pseudonocardia TaxID=1847 RepID=A0A1Y2MVW0_PSEAH|nr:MULTISPECIES: FAD-dependent oxidoreductase [Pseudonocardia]OSY39261.1 Pentachlorophenol 4-monooxygenase [Pseudonocardia autotrophica]TDN76517.1 2-polyprenyl-6-methoxyphenol hydroxylase-like FAD-dependent oxidoreductase [Pseudonocardia autotrophica]BBG00517.1 FAD-dependent oxidoreductase [Pseudonocardia autotrophica]GEC26477.1 FAD-dependent oxidoreductase [Pseudonocardia saturnea]